MSIACAISSNELLKPRRGSLINRLHAFLLSVVIGLFLISEAKAQVTTYYNGLWALPAHNGSGFSVTIVSPTVGIVFWYTYDPFGNPLWIIGDGQIVGNSIKGGARVFQGMKFGEWDPADNQTFNWGTFELKFESCNSATFFYDSNLSYQSGEEFGSGSFPLYRLANTHQLQCSPKPQAGLYQGLFYSNAENAIIPGFVILSPDGKFAALSFDAMVAVGNWNVNGMNFSGSGTAVSADPDFSFSSNFSVTGQISSEYRLVGNYNVSGGDNGSLDFYAMPALYRRGLSLQSIAGNYTAENLVSGGTGPVSISASGVVSGSDSFGCNYNGQISITDTQFNGLQIAVTVSNCGVSNGTYNGYGAQIDYQSLGDGKAIRLVATNNTYAGIIDLVR